MEKTSILLTGATGFVGGHLWRRLRDQRHSVRCLTRRPEDAREQWPERDWWQGDLARQEGLDRALEGCRGAYFLVHGMASDGDGDDDDFRRRELEAAKRFLTAAEKAGLERIVYLGGIEPQGEPSEHLRSRLEVGELLRAGRVAVTELRASMIVGHGSISWQIVRDLAARLPAMVLPDWVDSRTEPVALDDVLVALAAALARTDLQTGWWNVPGPEILSLREILERTAVLIHGDEPVVVEVPDPFPELSVKLLELVTDADPGVTEKIAIGMTQNVISSGQRFWDVIGHDPLISFDRAARKALEGERWYQSEESGLASSLWRGVEALVAKVSSG